MMPSTAEAMEYTVAILVLGRNPYSVSFSWLDHRINVGRKAEKASSVYIVESTISLLITSERQSS